MIHPLHLLKISLFSFVLGMTSFNAMADAYEEGLMAYTTGNFAEAGQHLMAAAENGNTGAEHMLMRLFSEGKLSATNLDQETLKWTQKAAEKGIMQAQYSLAEIYSGKPENMKTAVKWYRKAATQGHPDAYYKLGEILGVGAKGVDADSEESSRMYQIAASEYHVYAQMGHANYQLSLGDMYLNAKGVKKDVDLALAWMSKSAMQGHALAQFTLGHIYANSTDVPRDAIQARYWLQLAAAQGYGEAITMLDELNNTTVAYAM